MRAILVVLAIWPAAGAAQEWVQARDAAAIRAALADRTVQFDAYTRQHYAADGATRFVTEREASGRWEVRDAQVCHQWPPSERWECYDLETAGSQVGFIYNTGAISEGRLVN